MTDTDKLRQIVEYREPKDNKRKYAWVLPLKTNHLTQQLMNFLQSNEQVCILFTEYVEESVEMLFYMKHLIHYVECDMRWNKFMRNNGSYILHRCFFNEEKLLIIAKEPYLIPQYVQLKSYIINYSI